MMKKLCKKKKIKKVIFFWLYHDYKIKNPKYNFVFGIYNFTFSVAGTGIEPVFPP